MQLQRAACLVIWGLSKCPQQLLQVERHQQCANADAAFLRIGKSIGLGSKHSCTHNTVYLTSMLVRCQRRYRAGIKVVSGWTSDDFVTGELQTITVGSDRQKAEIRVARGAPVVLWTLYNVQFKSLGSGRVTLSGLEPIETSRGTRWVYQFWFCELMSSASTPELLRMKDATGKPTEASWKRATGVGATSSNGNA